MEELWKRLLDQLKIACQGTQARWAACYERQLDRWALVLAHNVSRRREEAIEAFLEHDAVSGWAAGALGSGRTRSRASGRHEHPLGCERVFVFPHPERRAILLVGAGDLGSQERTLFRALSRGIPARDLDEISSEAQSLITSLDLSAEISYNFQETLERILPSVAAFLPCQAAYIAIRQGDVFRIEGRWNCSQDLVGRQVSTDQNPLLESLTLTQEPATLTRRQIRTAGDLLPVKALDQTVRSWMGVPLILGRRMIGLLVFLAYEADAFNESLCQRAGRLARQVAPFVENALVFAEARRHLQRLALLNELASTASAGLEIEQVARRVLRMLRRTFRTEQIALLLLSSDGKTLREYGEGTPHERAAVVPVSGSFPGRVVETGLPRRESDGNGARGPRVRSEMAVPLKYRGNVVGVLDLKSEDPNAFTEEDQQLLVVIASHLAGLLENVRLSEETRARARNLGLIHAVVQRVVGLMDLNEIARLSAQTIAEEFDYDLAVVVALEEEPGRYTVGVGGGAAVDEDLEEVTPVRGILGHVLSSGQSVLVQDPGAGGQPAAPAAWETGSLVGVPLWEGERVLGAIEVQRDRPHAVSDNDLLVLESMAGFLSSVMMNARHYRQLQTSIGHMQAARETALDISADLDLDALLQRVVQRVRDLVGVMGMELGLVDEREQKVRVLASESPGEYYLAETVPLMADVTGRVAALGQAVVVNDYQNWSGRIAPEEEVPYTCVAGVPLIYKGEVIGALTVFDDQPDRVFRQEDVQLLELLAPPIAISIRNARLYQELQERIQAHQLAERQLVQSARLAAVGEMAAGVAHELNNPLTTVTGFSELVLEELPEGFEQRPDLELILREAKRARQVVRRLLDFSRQSESVRDRADMNEVVEDVVALIRHLARTGGVESHLELSGELPPVHMDSNQMKQVLLNLVHNALHAMPAGGDLTIRTRPEARDHHPGVYLEICDTGGGIPEHHLGRIFEPFFTTKPTGTGTGLGLAISYGIVSDHGGVIEVESEEGEGSCFSIWMPAVGEHVDA